LLRNNRNGTKRRLIVLTSWDSIAAVKEAETEELPWRIGLAVDAIDARVHFLAKTPNSSVEEKRKTR
jgi:hypothetical protein